MPFENWKHPLQCRCGTVKGFVENPQSANRAVCYCKDCQAFAHFLGREREILDERGGTDVVQTLPKNVTFIQRSAALACVRLTDNGLLRWYAGCCNTPIGNTLDSYKFSFIGLVHTCLETPDESLQDFFGPVRVWAYTKGKHTPFFRVDKGTPISAPRVLSGAELASVKNAVQSAAIP